MLSQRQVLLRYGFNQRHLRILVGKGVLTLVCSPGRNRGQIAPESLACLVEGEHYVVCLKCGAWQAQITGRHLRACSGGDFGAYRREFPDAPFMSSMTKENKAKTEVQKREQSETLKTRFQTPAGELTRQQIAEASKRLHNGLYGPRAAKHLRRLNRDPEQLERKRKETTARWVSGELREAVEGWHRDNREKSLASAAWARRYIKRKRTKLHMRVKRAMEEAGFGGFVTEAEVGYYAIDEARPELKLSVEVDGCYWHGCDACGYPPRPKTAHYDKRKTTYLKNRGWTILRLAEHEVNADLAGCVERVRREVERLEALRAA